MKVLVTGGAGFISSNIVFELVKRGFEAFIVDNLRTVNERSLDGVLDSVKGFQVLHREMPSLSPPRMDVVFQLWHILVVAHVQG